MSKVLSNEIFAKHLKMLMDKHNVTARQLSKITGASYNCVTSWLRGERYPRIGKLEAMAQHFGCQKSDLIEENDDSELLSDIKLRLEGLTGFELDEINDYITMLMNRRTKR